MRPEKRAREESLQSQQSLFAAGHQHAHKRKRQSKSAPDEPRGVSKIKADMRQTRRLLAKDNLAPDVRTVTERRLVALEHELENSEQSSKERKMVLKYKKIKFFDRTKIMRRINQAKKALAEDSGDQDAKGKLDQARVDLYYVNRFPKDQKYVALFPEGEYVPLAPSPIPDPSSASSSKRGKQTRKGDEEEEEGEGKAGANVAPYVRDSLRRDIMRDIASGKLKPEAESDVSNQGHEKTAKSQSKPQKPKKSDGKGTVVAAAAEEHDDFFE